MRVILSAIVLGWMLPLAAWAAVVEGLQMPAWLEHGGQRMALNVGMTLGSGDVIHTGTGARVLLRLEEGSHVKLGEEADLDLATLEPPADEQGVFRGVLKVLKGAFRFTTSAIGKARARDIEASVAAVTIGIRGTDVWGKAAPDRDFVVLIEGRIDIRRGDEAQQTMGDPLTVFMAPKGAPVLPVTPVNMDDLKVWAQETELQEGQGIIGADGGWIAYLASYRDHAVAGRALARLTGAGYAATLSTAEIGGQSWSRVGIAGFATRADAEAIAGRLGGEFGFTSPWVGR